MTDIMILDGARRLPRADILIKNREPGLFSNFSTTQLGGKATMDCMLRVRLRDSDAGAAALRVHGSGIPGIDTGSRAFQIMRREAPHIIDR